MKKSQPSHQQLPEFPVWLVCGAIFLLAVVAYWPVFRSGFIWDDDSMLTANPLVKASSGLRYIWFSAEPIDYFPLTYSSLWLEWHLWGMHALGYHLTNLFLHAASCLLLWQVLLRLKVPGAWLAALIFLVHPVNVESVAWIAERKNTLAMVFYLLTLWFYLRSEELPNKGRLEKANPPESPVQMLPPAGFYALSIVSFVLALLSKTSVVMLPVALLLCAWWKKGKITKADVMRSVPFFALSLFFGLLTIWFQNNRAIAGDFIHNRSFAMQIAIAGRAVWFYLFKAVAPVDLSFVYSQWKIDPSSAKAFLPGIGLLAAFVVAWQFRKTWGRTILFVLGYFVLLLFPVLGFFKIYFQRYAMVADHWQYFALPSVVALAAALIWSGKGKFIRGVVGGAIVFALIILTWQQTAIYADQQALWKATLKKNPQCWLALNNLGLLLDAEGKHQEAISCYQQSLQFNTNQIEAYNNMGTLYYDLGNYPEALQNYQMAYAINPSNAVTHHNLGNVYDHTGRPAEAKAEFLRAVELKTDYPEARNNLACVLALEGKRDEAIEHLRKAVFFNPDFADAQSNLGSLLTDKGLPQEALPYLQRAVELSPNHSDAHHNLGNALMALNQTMAAITQYSQAVQINPNMTVAHFNLARALMSVGQGQQAFDEFSIVLKQQPGNAEAHYQSAVILEAFQKIADAVAHLRMAAQIRPDWIEPINNLAWIYATHKSALFRDGEEALRLATRAAELTHSNNPAVLDTLGAAYAQNGDFEKASAAVKKGLALLESSNTTPTSAKEEINSTPQQNLAVQMRKRLQLYEAGKPFRE